VKVYKEDAVGQDIATDGILFESVLEGMIVIIEQKIHKGPEANGKGES
jgi:hypothetical protein